MLNHTDQKSFCCDECDQAFCQKKLLRRHKIFYHNPNYVVPLPKGNTIECSECKKAFRYKDNLIRHLAIHDPEASMAEKEEALRIGEPKGPGEQPDGEEEYYVEEEHEEEIDQTICPTGTVTISDQVSVQETEDGQQVVVCEVIQLHPQNQEQEICLPEEIQNADNGESVSLITLEDVEEEASAVAEAIGEVPHTPSSPEPFTPRKGRGRPRKHPALPQQALTELMKQIKIPITPHKGRGRPRKYPALPQQAQTELLKQIKVPITPHKGRGRPRKYPALPQQAQTELLKQIKVEEDKDSTSSAGQLGRKRKTSETPETQAEMNDNGKRKRLLRSCHVRKVSNGVTEVACDEAGNYEYGCTNTSGYLDANLENEEYINDSWRQEQNGEHESTQLMDLSNSVKQSSLHVLNAFRKRTRKDKSQILIQRAAKAIVASKEAKRHFYEQEEVRAKERHEWEKERSKERHEWERERAKERHEWERERSTEKHEWERERFFKDNKRAEEKHQLEIKHLQAQINSYTN